MNNTTRALAIVRKCPDGISPDALAQRLYANDPEGGPLGAVACVHIIAMKLKRRGLIVADGNNHCKVYKPAPSPAWDASALLAMPG